MGVLWKRTCRECHYLAGFKDDEYSEVNNYRRKQLLTTEWSKVAPYISCYLGNWRATSPENNMDEQRKTRTDCVEFARYVPRMDFEAVLRRQETESEALLRKQEMESDKAKLQRTTNIAIAGLLLTAFFSLLTLLCNAVSLGERVFEFVYKLAPVP